MSIDTTNRVAVKVSNVVTEYALDSFISSTTTSPKQVIGSSGNLAWSPHNMFLNSGAPVTQNVTLLTGATYTMDVTGSGSLAGTSGASGTATAGAPATFTATGVTGTFTKTGTLTTMQLNRGTVPTNYLVTTGAARYGLALDYDPVTLAARGLLTEPAATNLLLNSTTLSTQTRTVTAVAHMLSFWGTGTITLSGVSTAGPLVGTGVNDRVSLAFTPTAGSLTLTVSGTVSNAQLEIGTVATSFIPTYAGTVTRAADNYTFLLSTIPALGAEYSMLAYFSAPVVTTGRYPLCLSDGTANEIAAIRSAAAGVVHAEVIDGGAALAQISGGTLVSNVPRKVAARFKANDVAISGNGGAVVKDLTATLPTLTTAALSGGSGGAGSSFATFRMQQVVIVPRAWSDVELVARSTP